MIFSAVLHYTLQYCIIVFSTALSVMQSDGKWQSNVYPLNPFLIGLLNIVKTYQHIESLYMLGYEIFGRFSDGV